MSENKESIFPKIEIIPNPFKALARAVGSFVLNRHEIPNGGGGPFLDAQLCPDEVQIPESTQLMLDYNCFEE